MGASKEFVAYVRDLLVPLEDFVELSSGSFFGGFAFKSETKQFAMIMGNTLYFCVDASSRPKYQSLQMQPFSYTTKKGTVKVNKYFTAPEELFENEAEFLLWAKDAIRAASS